MHAVQFVCASMHGVTYTNLLSHAAEFLMARVTLAANYPILLHNDYICILTMRLEHCSLNHHAVGRVNYSSRSHAYIVVNVYSNLKSDF